MYENENYVDHTQNYSTYQTTYVDAGQESVVKKEKKKGNGNGKKVCKFVLSALCFGMIAGVGFCGVQTVWQHVSGEATMEAQGDISGGRSEGKLPELNLSQGSEIKVTTSGNTTVSTGSTDIVNVVEDVMPAMVSIVNNYTSVGTSFFGQSFSRQEASSGSGIIVAESDSELLIVSNNHVVADADQLEVTFIDGSTAVAQIKGLDAKMDLAVISIPLEDLSQETKDAIAVATIGNSDNLKLGESVIAIGNALGYGQSVTRGIVSALNREITSEDGITGTFIQTDAAINPGNSGGALLNTKGEVIGINSNKIGGSIIEGMGYAIPISAASPIISDLMLRETRNKVAEEDMGYLGVYYRSVTQDIGTSFNMPMGIYVTEVMEGGPAEKAGLVARDIIVAFDGRDVNDAADLQEALTYYKAGETVEIEVLRIQNGKYESIIKEVTLGKRTDME